MNLDDHNIPDSACFRRAEGIRISGSFCGKFDEFQVIAEREGGGTSVILERTEVAFICGLNRWQTADEANKKLSELIQFVDADLLFWSSSKPTRNLSQGSRIGEDSTIALRPNVRITPLVSSRDEEDQPISIPFMPRRGELDGVAIVGFEFAVMEMETATYSATIACCADHARTLRDLIPRLDGRSRAIDLSADLDTREILGALIVLGLIESFAPPPIERSTTITWLCHAGVLYQASGRRIVIDPLEYPASVPSRFAISPPDFRSIGPLDAILITHSDNDHLNPRTLCRFDRNTPIFVPKITDLQPYQVDTDALLALLGFHQITSLEPWERRSIGDVVVLAVPFRGEDWGLTLASSSYVVSDPSLTIYANADSITTTDAYPRIASEFSIDVAFVGVTDAAEAYVMPAGYGYGHFYAPWILPERRNEWVQLCNGPREAADVAKQLGARFAFGYAAGGAVFATQEYTDRGTHQQLAAILSTDRDGPVAFELPLGRAVTIQPRAKG